MEGTVAPLPAPAAQEPPMVGTTSRLLRRLPGPTHQTTPPPGQHLQVATTGANAHANILRLVRGADAILSRGCSLARAGCGNSLLSPLSGTAGHSTLLDYQAAPRSTSGISRSSSFMGGIEYARLGGSPAGEPSGGATYLIRRTQPHHRVAGWLVRARSPTATMPYSLLRDCVGT